MLLLIPTNLKMTAPEILKSSLKKKKRILKELLSIISVDIVKTCNKLLQHGCPHITGYIWNTHVYVCTEGAKKV